METPDEYFSSYENFEVHGLMLSDNPRMTAYKNAILDKKDLFHNKIVMDVGSGTGILSIFCAQAGAAKVYSVEASKLSELIEQVVDENNYKEVIKIIPSKLEDIKLEINEKVDIIVSEWMGFYLVHEGMLDTILTARDRFLKSDGLIFPCIAKLYAVPCQVPSLFEFWENIYGVKMTCIGKAMREQKSSKPEIILVDPKDIIAEEKILAWIDLKTATSDDLNTIGGQDLVFPSTKNGKFEGVCIWWDVEFHDDLILSTAPSEPPTHWKQTLITLPNNCQVEQGEPIAFRVTLNRNNDRRKYNLELVVLNPDETDHDLPCSCYFTKCIVAREYLKHHSQEIDTNNGFE
ncbi:GSCOCG00001427001-RA-CDS [Cotesia congregata]|uniref:type I protein arginine methyltransferase n=1 Tax=Cotesia congregata TaxID=51543 RepID=A0A8J2EI76_COTCN|nr:GSCOCG00001427001-RA-CDS [Cotesia congregata]CAG5076735.1 Similar to prmt8b: Protein arginine N-methyltransferase 8-B (Danio rerio) [Cotesia congregata]